MIHWAFVNIGPLHVPPIMIRPLLLLFIFNIIDAQWPYLVINYSTPYNRMFNASTRINFAVGFQIGALTAKQAKKAYESDPTLPVMRYNNIILLSLLITEGLGQKKLFLCTPNDY